MAVRLGLISPFVLLDNVFFLLGGEIVGNVEKLADVFSGFALEENCTLGTSEVQKRLDIHVVRRQNKLKKQFLLNVNESSVPGRNHIRDVPRLQRLFNCFGRVSSMVLEVVQHFGKDRSLDIGKRDDRSVLV